MNPTRYQDWEPVIGLEVHCQLATRTKIFCGCSTLFGAPPNSQTCPVCLGLPGALPVLNAEGVRFAIMAALATHCTVQPVSIFARKNYFYPDLPKGYQISQYERPLATAGWLEIDVGDEVKRVSLTRIHMEEDAGKNLHGDIGGTSLVDLNRAGVPLIEIVSGPDMRSAEEAVAYLKALHAIVTTLGVTDGNMERGNFRCDANISVRRRGDEKLGTRVELKNLNSFRFLGKAIQYEIERQIDARENGEDIRQQTRLWDQERAKTVVMREKEEAHDYRYFPDPDLRPLVIGEELVASLRAGLPELPRDRAARFRAQYALPAADAEVLTGSVTLADFFEAVAGPSGNPRAAANWVIGELQGALNREGIELSQSKVRPSHLAGLIRLIDAGTISGKIAKTVFEEVYATGGDPAAIIEAKGLKQVSDTGAIEAVIDQVITAHPKEVAAYRSGKDKLFGFFVGQVMKASRGQANPGLVNELLKKKLEAPGS